MTNLEALRFYNKYWGSLHGPFLTKKRLSIETKEKQPPFLTNETEKGRGAICPRPER